MIRCFYHKAETVSFFAWCNSPLVGQRPPHYRGFAVTLRHTTLGRTPLDDWSAPRRELYLTTHVTHYREIFMPPAGFQLAIPAIERRQTDALDSTANGIRFYLFGIIVTATLCWRPTCVYLHFGAPKYLSELKISQTKLAEKNITYSKTPFIRINWNSHPDMQKIRIIWFFFENG
jgi:hypothetical protein